jgi:hypothetical protein
MLSPWVSMWIWGMSQKWESQEARRWKNNITAAPVLTGATLANDCLSCPRLCQIDWNYSWNNSFTSYRHKWPQENHNTKGREKPDSILPDYFICSWSSWHLKKSGCPSGTDKEQTRQSLILLSPWCNYLSLPGKHKLLVFLNPDIFQV